MVLFSTRIVRSRGFEPERAWMIGNSPKSDINPAIEVGINAAVTCRTSIPGVWSTKRYGRARAIVKAGSASRNYRNYFLTNTYETNLPVGPSLRLVNGASRRLALLLPAAGLALRIQRYWRISARLAEVVFGWIGFDRLPCDADATDHYPGAHQ